MKKFYCIFTIAAVIFIIGCTQRQIPNAPVDVILSPEATIVPTIESGTITLLEENLEGYAVGVTPTGWTRASIYTGADVYAPVSNTAYVSFNKALNIRTFTGTAERQILKAPLSTVIPNTNTGRIDISFFVRKTAVNKGKGFVFYINQKEKTRIDFDHTGNILYYTNKNVSYSCGSYVSNSWYYVFIAIDLLNDTYSLTVNNVPLITDVPCYNTNETTIGGTDIPSGSAVYTTFFGIMTNINTDYMNDVSYIDSLKIVYTE